MLLQNLEQTVRKLIAQDRDPDVAQAIRTAVTEMDRIEVAMETVSRLCISLNKITTCGLISEVL